MYLVLAAIGFLALVQGQIHTTTLHMLTSSVKLPEERVTKMEHLTSTEGHLMSDEPECQCEKCPMAYEEAKKNGMKLDELKEEIDVVKYSILRELNTTCNIEIASVSPMTPESNEVKKGYIKVNDMMASECNNQMTGSEAKAGLLLCSIRADTCTVHECRHFSTFDKDILRDGKLLKMYIENIRDYVTLVGTCCGDCLPGLGRDGKLILKVLNAPVDEVEKGDRFGFIIQTKKPWEGLFTKEPSSTEPLKLKFMIEGLSTCDYGYTQEKL